MQKLFSNTKLATVFGLMLALVLMPFAALAASPELIPPIEALPGWAGVMIAVLYGVAHAVALLPTSITARFPNALKEILNFVAANYGAAKNENKQ